MYVEYLDFLKVVKVVFQDIIQQNWICVIGDKIMTWIESWLINKRKIEETSG